ncbi:hypothetical protein B0I27_11198 [Arcticibacter pallidicorallinus]|uniref:DUF4625 domain-containing protein n=1 Tax=Arcticibacter pallidicorallinus TaxID=1259464 RepID=A0A2T0TV13_9SPHI|nr:hypothetical protein [Arcticibacter pallidicorallinus]PRY49542.1 hypothetical protein B0I27_11198 [Arcticibacter pallidicorallinus]
MTKKNQLLALAFILISTFFMASCSKDDPQPEIEQEEPDAAKLVFTKLDANGDETQTKVTVNFDELSHDHDHAHAHSSTATVSSEEEHDHEHAHIHLDPNSTYRLNIEMYRDGKIINDEFIKAADEHQFFFFAKDAEGKTVSNFINYVYEDKDQNNYPIGLKGKFSTLGAGTANIQVILSHGLDKSKVPAGVFNYENYSLIGDTDLDQTFELHIEAE